MRALTDEQKSCPNKKKKKKKKFVLTESKGFSPLVAVVCCYGVTIASGNTSVTHPMSRAKQRIKPR